MSFLQGLAIKFLGLIAVFTAGLVVGYRYESNAWRASNETQAVAVQKRLDANAQLVKDEQYKTEQANEATKSVVAMYSGYVDRLVRQRSSGFSAMSCTSPSPAGPDDATSGRGASQAPSEAPGGSEVPPAVTAVCSERTTFTSLVGSCILTTWEVMQWRKWARSEGLARNQ